MRKTISYPPRRPYREPAVEISRTVLRWEMLTASTYNERLVEEEIDLDDE